MKIRDAEEKKVNLFTSLLPVLEGKSKYYRGKTQSEILFLCWHRKSNLALIFCHDAVELNSFQKNGNATIPF